MIKIGFIGCGNMGGALATAISKFNSKSVFLYDKNTEKAKALAEKTGANLSDIKDMYDCDFLFIGVKPYAVAELLSEIAPRLSDRTVIVSMAAGVTISDIKAAAGEKAIIRIMPNTPVAYGKGVILAADSGFNDIRKTLFREIISFAGMLDEIPEELIDAGTAVSGCGPAFAYMFIDALAEGGVKAGLSKEKALSYAANTVIGAATTLLADGRSAEELRDAVCSPGGSTIEGVKTLLNGDLGTLVSNSVTAAYERTQELGKKDKK